MFSSVLILVIHNIGTEQIFEETSIELVVITLRMI